MKKNLTKGFAYDLEHLPEEVRRSDLIAQVNRGNHQSASDPDNEPTLLKNYDKKISRGWMLPVTKEHVTDLKDVGFILIGVAK